MGEVMSWSPRTYLFAVVPPGRDEPIVVEAENWVFGLGTALERLGQQHLIQRLICEIHPDGMIVAEDRMTHDKFVVYRVSTRGSLPVDAASSDPATATASSAPANLKV
jgi:hypothetical protein